MPVNRTMLASLRKKYGFKRGTEIYYKMEAEGKPPFKKGLKTAIKEGHTQKGTRKSKKK